MTDEVSIYELSHAAALLPSKEGRMTDRKALCYDCIRDRLMKGWSILGKESPPFKFSCQDCGLKKASLR